MSDEIQNVTCPLCRTPGFSASGLRRHHCDTVNRKTGIGTKQPRRFLSAGEYVDAIQNAKQAQQPSIP